MALDHFDIESFEASAARYFANQFRGKPWLPSTQYRSGALRGNATPTDRVTPPTANGYCYACLSDGVSGGTPPVFPLSTGATISDGSTSWQCQKPYDVIYEESTTDFDQESNWFYVELLGNNGQSVTSAPVNHIAVHIRTRGMNADADISAMTRLAVSSLKDKCFTLYDVQTGQAIGLLRTAILREFPRESVRQARGFNRSLLAQVTYGKVGVVYV